MSRRGRGDGSITQRSDGRWQARLDLGIVDARRRRISAYATSRAEAKEKLKALEAQHAAGLVLGRSETVAQYLATWLAASKGRVRPSTWRRYEQLVRVQLTPGLGRVQLDELTPAAVDAFLARRLDSGLAPRSVHHLRAVLRSALSKAVRQGYLLRNAAALTDAPKVPAYRYQVLNPEQARSFLAAVRGHRLEALFAVSLALGLRQGEVLGLRWSDLDLEKRRLFVRHALQRIEGKLALVEPKTERSRRVMALPTIAVEALREQRVRQAQERLLAGSEWQDFDLVFTTLTGRPLSVGVVVRAFQERLAAAGLPRMRFHELRHSAASLLIAQGVDIRAVMELLGHSTITLTANTYGHLFDRQKDETAAAADRALGS